MPASAGGLPGDVYTEHYYLDGVRRVQEVHNNPVFPSGGGSGSSGEEQSMGEETGGSVANRTWVDREYVHTTGYVDEMVCETDEFDYPWYHLQDANYNVTAIVHESGFVASQRTFDPYGQVIRHQQFLAHPPSRVGHQGLFFDRLDAGLTASGRLPESLVTSGGAGGTTPVAVLGVYQNRNRTYLPHLGRFVQADPNGTASLVLEHADFAGRRSGSDGLAVRAHQIFADGVNRHAYLGLRPMSDQDPMGLEGLGGLSVSNAGRAGLQAYGTADRAMGMLDAVKSLAAGATLESVLIGAAADLLLDKVAGPYADRILDRIKTLRRNVSAGRGPRPPPRRGFDEGAPANTWVYALLDKDAVPRYFGISDDPSQRMAQHRRGRFERMVMVRITPTPVTRLQARALEESLILAARMRGAPIDNRRFEISPDRDFYRDAMEWASGTLRALGH